MMEAVTQIYTVCLSVETEQDYLRNCLIFQYGSGRCEKL